MTNTPLSSPRNYNYVNDYYNFIGPDKKLTPYNGINYISLTDKLKKIPNGYQGVMAIFNADVYEEKYINYRVPNVKNYYWIGYKNNGLYYFGCVKNSIPFETICDKFKKTFSYENVNLKILEYYEPHFKKNKRYFEKDELYEADCDENISYTMDYKKSKIDDDDEDGLIKEYENLKENVKKDIININTCNEDNNSNYEYICNQENDDDYEKIMNNIMNQSIIKQINNGIFVNFSAEDISFYMLNLKKIYFKDDMIYFHENINLKVYYGDTLLFELLDKKLINHKILSYDFKLQCHVYKNITSLSFINSFSCNSSLDNMQPFGISMPCYAINNYKNLLIEIIE